MAEQDLKATKKEVNKFIIPELSHLHLISTSSFFLYLLTKQLSFQDGTIDDEEHETADIEEMIEALLEEEFPAEEDEEDIENEETEELATNRLEIGIKERFVTQETNLSSVMVYIHKTKMSPDQFTCVSYSQQDFTLKYLYFTIKLVGFYIWCYMLFYC